jgi:hypothetical protein
VAQAQEQGRKEGEKKRKKNRGEKGRVVAGRPAHERNTRPPNLVGPAAVSRGGAVVVVVPRQQEEGGGSRRPPIRHRRHHRRSPASQPGPAPAPG